VTPRLLDAFCCAGGATRGYQLAGFHVTGVDISPQPRYIGDEFHQGDALEFIAEHGHEYDVIAASPPCQAYSVTRTLHTTDYPMLVEDVRAALIATGRPYVIENVEGAPMRGALVLCGTEFGLRAGPYWLRRHRLFESNVMLYGAGGCNCHGRLTAHVTGHLPRFTYTGKGNQMGGAEARVAMEIDWMTNAEIVEAIPPAFTRFIGEQLMAHLGSVAA
jgi:DNA (cytosine-5)-methyltransferase 1